MSLALREMLKMFFSFILHMCQTHTPAHTFMQMWILNLTERAVLLNCKKKTTLQKNTKVLEAALNKIKKKMCARAACGLVYIQMGVFFLQ